jgi:hypothetical protein
LPLGVASNDEGIWSSFKILISAIKNTLDYFKWLTKNAFIELWSRSGGWNDLVFFYHERLKLVSGVWVHMVKVT